MLNFSVIMGVINKYRNKSIKYLIKKGLKIGDNCKILSNVDFGSEPWLIEIGNHVEITGNVVLITHDGGTWVFRDQERYKNVIKYGKIIIKDNCFIGHNSILMPGITIGENCVIGAGSVVTHDIPANSVAAGVPARIISTTEEYAEKCLKNTPDYDFEAYKNNKCKEVLRVLSKNVFD